MEKDEKVVHLFMPAVLRRYRDLAGLSQQELADSMGVSKGFISALEGGRSTPSLDRLLQIAESLHVRPGELVDAMAADAEKRKG
jgi:Predicted transcriptional regulators